MNKKQIICTVGPSTFNKKKLLILKKKVDLFRINLSHTKEAQLKKKILFLKKIIDINKICIDTEGAQIRTAKIRTNQLKKNQIVSIGFDKSCEYFLYPKFQTSKIKKGTKIFIGFDNLKLIVLKSFDKKLICKVILPGKIEPNKGVHIDTHIKLKSLTQKDLNCIKISLLLGVKNFALSFTNKKEDVEFLRSIISNKCKIISKIETLNAMIDLRNIIKASDSILIDRGDLSRYIQIQDIPKAQEYILNIANKLKKRVYVATNLVESMVTNPYPTRAESNDIYQTLAAGAAGLVLAAETAIGKYPLEVVKFVNQCIKSFKIKRLNFKKKL